MEYNHRIGIAVLLLVFLLAPPSPSAAMRGLRNKVPEVYEIDYRGPETHSYLPPPDRSNGGSGRGGHRHHLRRQKHKSNDLRFVNNGRKEKVIHHG